nr:hypothetical protein [Tanacetum cinerariifolium]
MVKGIIAVLDGKWDHDIGTCDMGRREKSLSPRKSHDTGASYIMVMFLMIKDHEMGTCDMVIVYCIMRECPYEVDRNPYLE